MLNNEYDHATYKSHVLEALPSSKLKSLNHECGLHAGICIFSWISLVKLTTVRGVFISFLMYLV